MQENTTCKCKCRCSYCSKEAVRLGVFGTGKGKSLKEKLDLAIIDSDLKLNEIASRTGINKKTLYRIRENPETAKLSQLSRLSQVLDIELGCLISEYKEPLEEETNDAN